MQDRFKSGVVVAMVAIALGSAGANAADKAKSRATAAAAAPTVPTTIALGKAINLPGLDVSLDQVVPPGAEGSIGGEGFTEYVFTFKNTSADKELRLAGIGVGVDDGGEVRRMSKAPEMEVPNQGATAGKSAAMTAGAGALGLVGSFFGVGGVIASAVGTSAVGHKLLVDDPMKWGQEIQRRKLPVGETGQPAVYPGEEVKGSAFVKQSNAERPSKLQLYVKVGESARMYKFNIDALPAVAVVKQSD